MLKIDALGINFGIGGVVFPRMVNKSGVGLAFIEKC